MRLTLSLCLLLCGCPAPPDQRVEVASSSVPQSPPPVSSSSSAPQPAVVPSAQPLASAQPAPPQAEPTVAPEPEGAPALRRFTHQRRDADTTGQQRIDAAKSAKLGVVKSLFESAGVKWPPRQLLMRAFKKENRLEMWASAQAKGPLTHVTTYEICYASGELGPKRREGDRQVPEGFYKIVWFKPHSDYHMSMQVSYPNTSDKVLGHPKTPGGEIMIHGNCVSIGCLAMSDERIEEIWVIARAAPRPIDVHIFPTRDMVGLLAESKDSPHHAFWLNIKEGFDRFIKTKERFNVHVKRDGTYDFRDR